MPVAKPVNTVYFDFRLESWRGPPYHTFTPSLMIGAGYTNVVPPSVMRKRLIRTIPPRRSGAARGVSSVLLPANGGTPLTAYKIRMLGTTDNVLACFLVGERIDIGVII